MIRETSLLCKGMNCDSAYCGILCGSTGCCQPMKTLGPNSLLAPLCSRGPCQGQGFRAGGGDTGVLSGPFLGTSPPLILLPNLGVPWGPQVEPRLAWNPRTSTGIQLPAAQSSEQVETFVLFCLLTVLMMHILSKANSLESDTSIVSAAGLERAPSRGPPSAASPLAWKQGPQWVIDIGKGEGNIQMGRGTGQGGGTKGRGKKRNKKWKQLL